MVLAIFLFLSTTGVLRTMKAARDKGAFGKKRRYDDGNDMIEKGTNPGKKVPKKI